MSENCLMGDVVPGDIVYCGGGTILSPGIMKLGMIVAVRHTCDRPYYTVVISPTAVVLSEDVRSDLSIVRVYHDDACDTVDTCK